MSANWEVALARAYGFPAVAATAGELHVLEVGVDDVAVNEVPGLVNRLAVADGMGEVPDDAYAGVVGEVENAARALAGGEGVMGFESNADAVDVGGHGDFAQGLGDPAVDFVVGRARDVAAAEDAHDGGVPGVGKLNEGDGALNFAPSLVGGWEGESATAADDADFQPGIDDRVQDFRAAILGHCGVNRLAIQVAELQPVATHFAGERDVALN